MRWCATGTRPSLVRILYVFLGLASERVKHKKLTISVEAAVYEGLYRVVGARRINQFIEDLVRPHVIPSDLGSAKIMQ
jgi:hypothetical protein